MKNTNAQIHIKSVVIQDGDVGEINSVSECSYHIKNGKYYIIYEENQHTEMNGTTTMVKTDGTTVWVKRSGSVESTMQYSPGEIHASLYRFNFGALAMETTTTSVDVNLNENGGTIDVKYLLDMGGNKSDNTLNIRIKENANK